MQFNSVEFLLFLPIVLTIYYLLPHRWQNRYLLIASYVFYAAWDWRFLGLIAASTVVDFRVGRVLGVVFIGAVGDHDRLDQVMKLGQALEKRMVGVVLGSG